MEEFILFLSSGSCPTCASLEKRIPLDSVPHLTIYLIPEGETPGSEEDIKDLAEADFYEVYSVPTLIHNGELIQDVFEILKRLKQEVEKA